MAIRLSRDKDIQEITTIFNAAIELDAANAFFYPVDIANREKWYKKIDRQKYPIWVYEENDQVYGYVYLSPFREGRPAYDATVEISYYIHPDHWRKGIASALMDTAFAFCKSIQYENAVAILLDTNQGSVRLLEKHGFEQWGHLPKVATKNGKQIGQLIYGKSLI